MFREAFLPDRKPGRKPRRPVAGRFPWWIAALWVVLSATTGYVLFFSPFHMLETVAVSGNRDVPADRIEAFIREKWSRPIAYLVPGNGFFAFRTEETETALSQRFPKLSSVKVEKMFPDRVSVTVSERDRIFLFCSGPTCVLSDAGNRATDATSALSEENVPFIVRLEDTTGQIVAVGDTLFDVPLPDIALRLERGLREDLGLPLSPPLTTPGRVSREIRFRTEAGWEIYASADIVPEKTVEALRLVLERELPEDRRDRLRYVDLRTENKAFYAFEEEKKEEGEDTDGEADAGTPDGPETATEDRTDE